MLKDYALSNLVLKERISDELTDNCRRTGLRTLFSLCSLIPRNNRMMNGILFYQDHITLTYDDM